MGTAERPPDAAHGTGRRTSSPWSRDIAVRPGLGGVIRDTFGTYDPVRVASGAFCAMAALLALVIRGRLAAGPENYAEEPCNPSGVT